MPVAIVTRIAEREHVDPTELTPPLSSVIDTDALERIVRTAGEDATVTFEYRDWIVQVRGSGDVTIDVRETDE